MTISTLSILAAASTASAGSPPAWFNLVPFVGMFAVLWFLILRPQMRRQKEHQSKLGGIKKGDQVVTGGGLIGKVLKVDEVYAEVELGPNMKVKALKSTIADVILPGGAAPAND